ncbi:glycosyltransferase family 4 protein [Paenibacillus sp. N4]|uniref:glycosyltransferase family 4 protein n=1 Tax=Paenibacillus vietnamensis TaxID=2590547 RepID=UPI001CD0C602|nr:glycosyltransferase family 4 protein [Paenibacillus vietnamensis]MCA0755686.1 glycosyltransferase family 4 protein [Paenibacillus vietnamensis]
MKVAIYNHTSLVSGAEISMLLTAKSLTKAHPVIFAPEGEVLERARKQGTAVLAIPSYRARMSKNPFRLMRDALGMALAGWRLSVLLKKQQVDVIHANSIRAGIIAALFAWHHRTPLVWHLRDMPPQGLIGILMKRLADTTSHAFIGISESVLSHFRHPRLEGRFHLIHNGVELQETDEGERRRHRQNIRAELGTPQDARVAVIIGQIAPWKRQEDAIRAAAELIGKGDDFYLWIVGEAKFRKENEEYLAGLKRMVEQLNIGNRVVFTGFRDDVLEICCAADLLLLCSDNEPFGRVVIEAMSQGTPVIGTRAGGVPEIIQHNESGLLYPVADTGKLAELMRAVLSDEKLRRRLGGNGQTRVKEEFTIARTAEKVEKVYARIARREGAAGRSFDRREELTK